MVTTCIFKMYVKKTSVKTVTVTTKLLKKSRIRETKHLSTDADSSTDTTVGWTKNTQKPNFFENGKNHPKRKNSKNQIVMVVIVTVVVKVTSFSKNPAYGRQRISRPMRIVAPIPQ